jgi:hypothetical protein
MTSVMILFLTYTHYTSGNLIACRHSGLLLVNLDVDVTTDGVVPATMATVSYRIHGRPEQTYRT